MATTPNYSWPIPDDTDLVRDGAEAMRDLGNAIDTTVNGLNTGSFTLIQSGTFSGTTFAITSIPSGYKELMFRAVDVTTTTNSTFFESRLNNLSTTVYNKTSIDSSNAGVVRNASDTSYFAFNGSSTLPANWVTHLKQYETGVTDGRVLAETTLWNPGGARVNFFVTACSVGAVTEMNFVVAAGSIVGNWELYGAN